MKEREDYFNSKAHYKNIYDEQDSEFDVRMQKRRQTAKAKEIEELQKIRNQSTNSRTRRKSPSRKSKMRCSIQG